MKKRFGIAKLTTLFVLAAFAANAQAPKFATVYDFKGYPSDGSFPFSSSLIGSGGALYGGLDRGGASHAGAVYSLTPSQKANEPWTETILYNFSGEEGGNGGGPTAVGPGGVLYGVSGGGAYHYGQVFSLTPPISEGGAWTYSVLYDFTGETDGYFPEDVILGPNGVLYGITSEDTYGRYFGNVFALTPPTAPGGPWAESTLFGFDGTNGGAATGLVLGAGGVLYASGNSGIVFSLTPPPEPGQSWAYSVLANVGTEPFGIALGPGGVLYGTTTRGETGLGAGSVYSLTPPIAAGGSWTFDQLYEFAP